MFLRAFQARPEPASSIQHPASSIPKSVASSQKPASAFSNNGLVEQLELTRPAAERDGSNFRIHLQPQRNTEC
jgi:hypothetical protein